MLLKKLKTLFHEHVISYLKGEGIVGTFYEKDLQKINQKEIRVEKEIMKKGDKLYVKWKSCDSSFNSWINENDIVSMSEYFPEPKFHFLQIYKFLLK